MFSEDQLVVVDLIHVGEEEVAVRLLSSVVPWENIAKTIPWAVSEALSGSQAKYGTCFSIALWIMSK